MQTIVSTLLDQFMCRFGVSKIIHNDQDSQLDPDVLLYIRLEMVLYLRAYTKDRRYVKHVQVCFINLIPIQLYS